MDTPQPDPEKLWALLRYYGLAVGAGLLGSAAGLLVDYRDEERVIDRAAVLLYLVCGAVLALFSSALLQDSVGSSPVALGLIGLASLKAVDVLTSLALVASAVIERIAGKRG